jgi:ribose-phosphate pyrophosphokinase
MQGFFGKPVDNLFAEPFIARWIRMNVPGWKDAVVVSKNAGGTKRVTSLADTLKLNFGIVTTDRRRPKNPVNTMSDSTVFFDAVDDDRCAVKDSQPFELHLHGSKRTAATPPIPELPEPVTPPQHLLRPETPPAARRPSELEAANEYTDVRVRDVITGRLVQGQLVDDDYHIKEESESGGTTPGAGSSSHDNSEAIPDAMTGSMISNASSQPPDHALGGSFDAAESDDEGSVGGGPSDEKTITLVGEVRDRSVFIVDDMIDKSGSWIAAAETVVKRGGADKVYCIATHGLFTEESLDQMEGCQSIDHIVVTNTFPIPPSMLRRSKKLIIIDVSSLLAESIRRHHYGERFVLTDCVV